MSSDRPLKNNYGPQRVTIELANICNLHCNYCLRSEEVLYNNHAKFFKIDLLQRVLDEAREIAGITRVSFTGGEPTLHPQFSEVIKTVASAGLTSSFVTNGWHFDRIWPAVLANRESITHVAFSIDGITRELHDRWRGEGSFDRVVRAFSRCHRAGVPFDVKIVVRRDNMDRLEQIAIFVARMGAANLSFVHVMPTSKAIDDESLNLEERKTAEQEIALLARILKMNIGIDVGYYNEDPGAPCSPLAGKSFNIDYRGRLTLCCNLSGFRGATEEGDVVANLNVESFVAAYERLLDVAAAQLKRRSDALSLLQSKNSAPDLYTGSPCLFCMQSFGKIPWHNATSAQQSLGVRSLPVI
jgi:MoaA/NifB/PqqE/SkfB family radical SAM enzyme